MTAEMIRPGRQITGRLRRDETAHWPALLLRGRDGNARAYDRLLAEMQHWLSRYYARRLPAMHVDDAVQETLIAFHNRRDDYDASLPLRPWLAAIARFKWVDRLRLMERERAAPVSDPITASHEHDVVSGHAVRGLLGRLRPAQADAIRLVKIDGLSIVEASAACGQSQSLVKINIHRGLKLLAGQLTDAGALQLAE